MGGDFAGTTAAAYRRFRRDVPGAVLDRLVAHFGLGREDRAIDLGTGTGQVAVGLAARLAGVLALDPEPDMLVQLRRRAAEGQVPNLVCGLAAGATCGTEGLAAADRRRPPWAPCARPPGRGDR